MMMVNSYTVPYWLCHAPKPCLAHEVRWNRSSDRTASSCVLVVPALRTMKQASRSHGRKLRRVLNGTLPPASGTTAERDRHEARRSVLEQLQSITQNWGVRFPGEWDGQKDQIKALWQCLFAFLTPILWQDFSTIFALWRQFPGNLSLFFVLFLFALPSVSLLASA